MGGPTGPTTMDLIRSNKPFLIEVLSTDSSFILQHVQSKNLITGREYNSLHSQSQNGEKTITDLLDKLMSKGDERCHNFISLLGEREILDNLPGLRKLFSSQEDVPQQEVAQLPATDNPGENSPEVYTMNSKPRGTCVIFNNVNFSTEENRFGSDKDADDLKKTFEWLGFHVEILKDKTAEMIKSKLEDLSLKAKGDCFICCILSHGNNKYIIGVDESPLSIREVLSPFQGNSCPALAGKPKVFFIQACQGASIQSKVEVHADFLDENKEGSESDISVDMVKSIPGFADFLISMSTFEGFVSFRDERSGSWFIQSLCENLTKLCPQGEDILSILTKVNSDVSKMEAALSEKDAKHFGKDYAKQIPAPVYTLTKKLVFHVPK